MAARVLCIMLLLKQAKKSDDLWKRRQARELRNLQSISRDTDFVSNYRLSEDLFNIVKEEISAYLSTNKRSSGLSKRIKVRN